LVPSKQTISEIIYVEQLIVEIKHNTLGGLDLTPSITQTTILTRKLSAIVSIRSDFQNLSNALGSQLSE